MQVSLNCLLLDCLACAGKWRQALAHCETVQRLLPKAGLKEVAAWRAAALAHIGHRWVGAFVAWAINHAELKLWTFGLNGAAC